VVLINYKGISKVKWKKKKRNEIRGIEVVLINYKGISKVQVLNIVNKKLQQTLPG